MHYYKKNIGDYAKKCGRLSMLQHGSYTLLIDACYDRERFPTLEEAIEWTWASTKEEIEAVEFVLKRFFTLEDGVYVQKRIQEEIEAYQIKAEANKRIAMEREAKRKESKTNRTRTVHETSPDVNEAPPNQEPITNNQEPLTISKNKTKKFNAAEAELPPNVDPDNWLRWVEYRKSKRKPVTERAATEQLKLLERYDHQSQRAMVSTSIANDYQGLFAPRGTLNGKPTESFADVQRRQAQKHLQAMDERDGTHGGARVYPAC